MTSDRAIRFLEHEAKACRALAYAAPVTPGNLDELERRMDRLEALYVLLPSLLKIASLAPMDDAEAAAVRYQIKQELIGHNGHVHAS